MTRPAAAGRGLVSRLSGSSRLVSDRNHSRKSKPTTASPDAISRRSIRAPTISPPATCWVRSGRTNGGSTIETDISWPYGGFRSYSNSALSRIHYTGQVNDTETNLDYFGFRYYNSKLGRFMTPDPAGTAVADPSDPQSWNQYAYVENMPTQSVDPLGLDSKSWLIGGGATGVAAVVNPWLGAAVAVLSSIVNIFAGGGGEPDTGVVLSNQSTTGNWGDFEKGEIDGIPAGLVIPGQLGISMGGPNCGFGTCGEPVPQYFGPGGPVLSFGAPVIALAAGLAWATLEAVREGASLAKGLEKSVCKGSPLRACGDERRYRCGSGRGRRGGGPRCWRGDRRSPRRRRRRGSRWRYCRGHRGGREWNSVWGDDRCGLRIRRRVQREEVTK